MGRRPEPAQAKVLKGDFRPSRDTHGPRVEMRAPACPVWLPKSAKKYWREIAPQLERCGLIGLVDSAAFAVHCDSVGRYEDVTRKLKSLEQLIDETPQGYHMHSALFTVRNKLWDQVLRSALEFGLTPAGRSKVRPSNQQALPFEDSEWDAL